MKGIRQDDSLMRIVPYQVNLSKSENQFLNAFHFYFLFLSSCKAHLVAFPTAPVPQSHSPKPRASSLKPQTQSSQPHSATAPSPLPPFPPPLFPVSNSLCPSLFPRFFAYFKPNTPHSPTTPSPSQFTLSIHIPPFLYPILSPTAPMSYAPFPIPLAPFSFPLAPFSFSPCPFLLSHVLCLLSLVP